MTSILNLRPLGLACGIVTTIQGIISLALSIFGLLTYDCVLDVSVVNPALTNSSTDQFNFFLYTRYFQSGKCNDEILFPISEPKILTPPFVHIWVWLYFGFSLLWLILSIMLIIVFASRKVALINSLIFMWVVITIEICGMDVTLSILFGMDFSYIQNNYNESFKFQLLTAVGTMFFIVARCFVVLLVNIILAITLLTYALKYMNAPVEKPLPVQLRDDEDDDHTSFSSKFAPSPHSPARSQPIQWQPPIDAFSYSNSETERIPPWKPTEPPAQRPPYLGWTLRREIHPKYTTNRPDLLGASTLPNTENDHYHVPTPDYSPIMPRVSLTPARPLRPALKAQSQFGRNYF